MNLDEIIRDGAIAYEALKDSAKFINNLVKSYENAGAKPLSPAMRIKLRESVMEFEAPLEIKKKFLNRGELIELELPTPSKFIIYSLKPPYGRLRDAYEIKSGKVFLKRSVIDQLGGDIKVSMEYPIEDRQSLDGLVYTSSPKDSNLTTASGDEIIDYWLHAELKSVKPLRDIYSEVRVEDIEVKVEVAVKEHIKELFGDDLKADLAMRSKITSRDRNDRARAAYYLAKRKPRFKGDLDKVVYEFQELLRSSKFRRFIALKEGTFRLGECEKDVGLGAPIGPLYVPESMNVFSTTDLTLEDPAKNDNLLYKK